jgi:hypothetical protein
VVAIPLPRFGDESRGIEARAKRAASPRGARCAIRNNQYGNIENITTPT